MAFAENADFARKVEAGYSWVGQRQMSSNGWARKARPNTGRKLGGPCVFGYDGEDQRRELREGRSVLAFLMLKLHAAVDVGGAAWMIGPTLISH